jgi:hypothetical protein
MHCHNPLDLLVKFLSTYEEGRIILSAGSYEYKIQTKSCPKLVWLAEVGEGNQPVCQGGVNTFGITYLCDGFVLIADIVTDQTEILWQAHLKGSHDEGDDSRLV